MPEGRAGAVPAVIGIDLGTSETKAALVGLDGTLLELGRAGYPTAAGADGRAEQDPRDWYDAIASVVRPWFAAPRAGSSARRPVEVLAICCVGQGPTLTVVDDAGEPVRAAITWRDRRPGEAGYGLLSRIAWLGAAEPEAVARARWLVSAWDAVGLWLSGEAAWTLQGHEAAPSPPELADAGAPPDRVPVAIPFGSRLGSLRPAAADRLGLHPGVPVIAGVNDGTASMLGAGLREPGDAVDTAGTSGGLGIYAASPVAVPGLFLAPAPLAGRWVVGGAMAALGASVDWLRGPVLGGLTTDDVQLAAAGAPPGADGLVFLPYLAGERAPLFDDRARGAFFGLTLGHDSGHLARAVLEGTAFAMRSLAEPLAAAGAPIGELRLTGRPDASDTWGQIKADVLGVPVAIPAVGDTAAMGAAVLAAVGVGALPSLDAGVAAMTSIVRRLDPDPGNRRAYDAAYAVYRALYPALRTASGVSPR
jgi:xylulokinase